MKGIFILLNKWDKRFLEMAKLVASWSIDPSTQVGAVAVRNRTVIAQGYNGLPRGMKDTHDRLTVRTLKIKRIVHAEMNAIYNAAENGVSLKDSTVYVVGFPVCHESAKRLIQVGVKRIVTPQQDIPEKWQQSCGDAHLFFEEVGIKWDQIRL